jgi:hypothetical protein
VPVIKDLIVKESPWVDVRAYGTIVLGSGASAAQKTANAATIQAAIDNVTGNGAEIRLPSGIIYIDGDVVKLTHRIHLKGAGIHATELYWDSGVALAMDMGATTIVQPSISDLSLVGQGSTNKVGIRISDADIPNIQRVSMSTVFGDTSIGLQIRGRDVGTIQDLTIYADRPISIEDNPNSTIDIDHFSFRNMYLLTNDNTQANVHIDSGVNVNNVTFDGYQAWVLGKYGLYWNDTTSTAASAALNINNVRYEQSTDVTGHIIYIAHNYSLQSLAVNNLYGAYDDETATIGTNGIYLRKVLDATISNFIVLSTTGKYYFDFDNTDKGIRVQNVYYNPAATANLGTGVLTRWYAKASSASVISDALYDGVTSSPAAIYEPTQRFGIHTWMRTFALDNAATQRVLDPDTVSGGPWIMDMVCMETDLGAGTEAATFIMRRGANPSLLDNTANAGVGDVEGQITLYKIGSGNWVIQNKLGQSYTCTVRLN